MASLSGGGASGAIRYGNSGPKWGVKSESYGFMQDFDIRTIVEKATAEDEKGVTVAVEYFNKKWEGSFTIVDKAGVTEVVDVATAGVTLTNILATGGKDYDGPTDQKVVIHEVDKKRENKGFQKRTFTFERFSNVDPASVIQDDDTA